jgi:(E)-2-((N-methylformamido)methylene)succinate hydrolase
VSGDHRSSPEINCVVRGDVSARVPLIMLHGVGSDLTSWDEVIDRLPDDLPVIRYDLRGHGGSSAPPGPWTVDDFVADHQALLERLGVPRADTVGFSLGGLIAQRIAVAHPERVRRLVVIGAVAGRTESERSAVLGRLAMVEAEGPGGAARKSVDRWYSQEYLAQHPEVREAVVCRMERLDPEAYTNAYRVLATTDLADDLSAIRAPVLAMTGENDVGSPPRMSELMAQMTDGRLVILPGVRHEVLNQCPGTIAKEIAEHVR